MLHYVGIKDYEGQTTLETITGTFTDLISLRLIKPRKLSQPKNQFQIKTNIF